jgi:hypothetical protein
MPDAIVKTKFFHFNQNNPGGRFDVDNKVAHHVIIEAIDANHANQRAESIGIYFDGCSKGMDCDCCGDRWYAQWHDEKGMDVPMIYEESPEGFRDFFTKPNEPVCHIYYLDGLQKTYLQPERSAS